MRCPTISIAAAIMVLVQFSSATFAEEDHRVLLDQAQTLLDQQLPDQAIQLLQPILEGRRPDARAVLLHSSALFMQGEAEKGEKQLELALDRDPKLRQAWLNRGALDLAKQQYDAAYRAFLKASELDPADPENDLNLGVARLLGGSHDEAEPHFADYIRKAVDPAAASYRLAANYALAGYFQKTAEHLRAAIGYDEKQRLLAKTDSRFYRFKDRPELQQIFNSDTLRLGAESYVARQEFETGYEIQERKLLGAVIDALGRLGTKFDPRVEVTPNWALIWSEHRIKVSQTPKGQGLLEVSTPRAETSVESFRSSCKQLFEQVRYELAPKLPDRRP